MLFKEKLLLSNCDSVRMLNPEEIRKRFLTGLIFADGVILAPNALIDNTGIHALISQKNVLKYLNEEGLGKFIVRGININDDLRLVDYFSALPGDYIVSSLPGHPRKSNLTRDQRDNILKRLDLTQNALDQINPVFEDARISPESLKDEIEKRIASGDVVGSYFDSEEEMILFIDQSKSIVSRSQWYDFSDKYFDTKSRIGSPVFKSEIIDPSYNSLFAVSGEGFMHDNIKIIHNVPEILLDSGVALRSLRREIQYIQYPIKAFEIISSLGAGELLKFITDEALGYIEDKLHDKGIKYMSRRNWFGMYDVIKNKIGLEIK